MESQVLVLSFVMLLGGCGRKASPTITADPIAKDASPAPPKSDAAAVYALVLQNQLSWMVHEGSERIHLIDTTWQLTCGSPATLATSFPTARADTLATWARTSPEEQPLEPFVTTIPIERVPFGQLVTFFDAAALGPPGGTATPKRWPERGFVRFSPIAFDAARADALVGLQRWVTMRSTESVIVHVVRRDGSWFEQEILRCP